MTRLLLIFLFLFKSNAMADVKDREKARFDLISSIEILVNIDECRKDFHESNTVDEDLPRTCNSLPELTKFFFGKKHDRAAVDRYLDNEEAKISEKALNLVNAYDFSSLGKMTLSQKCVKNRDPVDLDIYLNRIKGVPVVTEESTPANELERQFESRLKNHQSRNDILMERAASELEEEPRTPAANKIPEPKIIEREPKGLFEKEMANN